MCRLHTRFWPTVIRKEGICMRKLIVFVILVGISMAMLCGAGVYVAQDLDKSKAAADTDNLVLSSISEETQKSNMPTEVKIPVPWTYDRAYAQATEEQKQKLEELKAVSGVGEYTRQIHVIMGTLPEGTPRITLEQAKAICAQYSDELEVKLTWNVLSESFNKIVGAPDYEGGSGIHRIVYFLDEEGTEAIVLLGTSVQYVNMTTGVRERIFPSENK